MAVSSTNKLYQAQEANFGHWEIIKDVIDQQIDLIERYLKAQNMFFTADAPDATYSERSAFLAFRLGADRPHRFDDLLRWTTLLRQPPNVTVKLESD